MASAQHETDSERLTDSDALRGLLSNLAQNYYDGEGEVEVEFTDKTAHAGTRRDGSPFVAVNVDAPRKHHGKTGAEALRLLADTLCHEVEHHNESEIDGKRDFMEDFDDGYAKLAGAAINILEDNRIDYTRTSKFRGLRKVHDWKIADAMEDDEWRPPMSELEPRQQALEGFTQLAFAGEVKGISDADPEVRQALSDIAPLCEQVKKTDDPAKREEMAGQAVERLTDVIPKTPDLPEWLEDMIEQIMDDLESGDFDPAEDAPPDADFDPEDAEQSEQDGEQDGEGQGAGEGEDAEGEPDTDDSGAGEADGSENEHDPEDMLDSASEGETEQEEGESAEGEQDEDGSLDDADAEGEDVRKEQVEKSLEDAEDWDQDWDEEVPEAEDLDADHDQTGDAEAYEWERDDESAPDIEEVDALEDAYERLREEQDKQETDLEQAKQDRDERLRNGEWANPDVDVYEQAGSEVVRRHVEESGQAQEVIDFFNSLKTQDRRIPSDSGSEMNDEAVLDLIAGDGSATDRMYLKKQKAETGDRVVGVTMDHSGSMRGVVKEAKSALGLLAMACEEIGDEFVANAFLSHEKRGIENIDIQTITAPDEDFEWRQLDSTWPVYQDPITPGMRQAKEMMEQTTAREEVLFVVTDGQPMICADGEYNAPKAIQEAKEEVRKLRHNGTKVIGIGIAPGVDARQMEEMFGEGGFFVAEQDEIAEKMIEAYRTQMKVEPGR